MQVVVDRKKSRVSLSFGEGRSGHQNCEALFGEKSRCFKERRCEDEDIQLWCDFKRGFKVQQKCSF